MPTTYHAQTSPVNPPGAEPVLTREQLWKGLARKVRHPTEFVPTIASCEIESDEGDVVTRLVEFKAGWGPRGKIREVCTSFAPSHILFEMENGSRVFNIVGSGPSGNPEDLFLTYVFEVKDINVSPEENAKTAIKAVEGSVARLRELAKNGQL